MRKSYPYLQNPYSPDLNNESKKRQFLKYVDDFINQRQYVKMTLLDWQENPIKAIEGIISSGSISKDGSSSVRRTCNLSCSVDGNSYNVDDMNMDFTLNRKIFIEIGIKNDSPYYKEYPILWFPQGVFFITSFSMNSSTTTAVNLSLGLKDKMALLNGDVGGRLPATVRFDVMDTQTSNGEWVEQKVLIYNIIQELVNHYGEEDLNNIIIEDVPLRIRAIMRWIGETPLYGTIQNKGDSGSPEQWAFTLNEPEEGFIDDYTIFKYGDDVGYIYQDFVTTKELIGSPGDSVCSILDQIKSMLGNYEYFYDEMGIFHFREIKNFLNVTQAEFLLDAMAENDYLVETTNEKVVYTFEDTSNITSITVTPQYDNIKNDYIVHGLRQGEDKDNAVLIMYHLSIDDKPTIVGSQPFLHYGMYNDVICYTDPLDGLNKLGIAEEVNKLPEVGNFNKIYKEGNNGYYYWDNNIYKKLYFENENEEQEEPKYYAEYYTKDWRTKLYLKGLVAQSHGTDAGKYFEELAAFWPREYNLIHDEQEWYVVQNRTKDRTYSSLYELNYFLDFIDINAELGQYSISAIGKRSDVIHSDDINCIFEPEINNVIFLNVDYPEDNFSENTVINDDRDIDDIYAEIVGPVPAGKTKEEKMLIIQRAECINNNHPFTQVHEDIYSNLAIGGYMNSAYERIRYELFCHTNYQKSISLTSIPVFYLEPNSRVHIDDPSTNTHGDYMVQNINLTLGPGANMAVNLSEIHERL